MPRGGEGVDAFALQPRGESVVVHAFTHELLQHRFGVATIGRQRRAHLAVVGKGQQGLLGQGIDRAGRRQGFHIERVWRGPVLGAGAGPEQALRCSASGREPLPAVRRQQVAIGLVGAHRDRNAQPVVEWRGDLFLHRDIPAADEQRGHGGDLGIEAGRQAALDAAHIGLRGRQIVFA